MIDDKTKKILKKNMHVIVVIVLGVLLFIFLFIDLKLEVPPKSSIDYSCESESDCIIQNAGCVFQSKRCMNNNSRGSNCILDSGVLFEKFGGLPPKKPISCKCQTNICTTVYED